MIECEPILRMVLERAFDPEPLLRFRKLPTGNLQSFHLRIANTADQSSRRKGYLGADRSKGA
jgi:hypothetical protein